jgi:hypothetical protein
MERTLISFTSFDTCRGDAKRSDDPFTHRLHGVDALLHGPLVVKVLAELLHVRAEVLHVDEELLLVHALHQVQVVGDVLGQLDQLAPVVADDALLVHLLLVDQRARRVVLEESVHVHDGHDLHLDGRLPLADLLQHHHHVPQRVQAVHLRAANGKRYH